MLMMPVAVVSAAYIESVSPVTGSYIGGDQISIVGEDFLAGTTLANFSLSTTDSTVGGIELTNVTRVSSTLITAITPAGTPGVKYNLSMKGANTASLGNAFTYFGDQPPTITGINGSIVMKYASTDGTTVVNISGTMLGAATSATFGGTSNGTIPFIANDGKNITMKAPARSSTGLVTISVTTPNGSASYRNLTYVSAPVITSVSPAYGSSFGGETVTIIATGDVNGASAVYFNTTLGTDLTVVNSTAVTVKTPVQANTAVATFVNITTEGGRSANSLFTFYNPPNIYPTTSDAISVQNGSYLGGTTVIITGTNFTSASAVKFNGTPATSFTVNSANEITAVAPAYATNVSINMVWPTGLALNVPVNVTTYTGVASGTTTNNYGNFTYDILKPNITSISPTSGSTAGGNVVTITGKNLSYASKVYFFRADSPSELANTSAGVTVISDTQITCIAPSSTLIGAVTLNVTTPAGFTYRSPDRTTAQYSFTAVEPSITTVSPDFGPDTGGQWVNITGTGFSGTAKTGVAFNGVNGADAYVFNDTALTVKTPAYALSGVSFISISAAGGSITKQNAYTFRGFPHIVSISPIGGAVAGGNTVTITGYNLTGTSFVRFNLTPATGINVVSDTSVTAIAPASNASASGPVIVNVSTYIKDNIITKTYQSNPDDGGNDAYTYSAGPTLISISPVSGSISGGTFVTLRGANLANASAVTFGGLPATNFTRYDAANQVTANVPATTVPGPVNPIIVTPAGSVTNTSVSYTYYGSPVITSIAPSAGPLAGGNLVTITGTSFVGASQVTFDGIQATNFTYVDSTKITANAPTHVAGAVTVLVSATGGTGTGTYTYQDAPTVTGLSPSTGSVLGGTSVTITGTNFLGATAVNFGSTAATSYAVVSGTSITATSPAGTAGVVNVTVTTASGTSAITSADEFTYIVVPTTGSTVGVYRNGVYYLASSNVNGGGTVNGFTFGTTNDKPVVVDNKVGVFRDGVFYLASANVNGGGTVNGFTFGTTNDKPVVVDNKVGVFRDGVFYLASANVNGGGTVNGFTFGTTNDKPVVVDNKVGVFRDGVFYLASANVNGGGTVNAFSFGTTGDVPVVWNHDGIDTVGVFRNGVFYLASANQAGGGTVNAFTFGTTNDKPVAGAWA
jgi:hypothetical protein